ncbi:hypothetical protein AB0K25_12985 [Micromonospora sp. NPDC049257]|uniref:hypothetical protein n=1 Tax=Micromonospora sp. NPDC049257 TaxID=3155771 RepID=UPI00342B9E75
MTAESRALAALRNAAVVVEKMVFLKYMNHDRNIFGKLAPVRRGAATLRLIRP